MATGAAAAQTTELSVSVGAAVPSGSAGRERSVGPAASVTTGIAVSDRVVIRLSFSAAQLEGEAGPHGLGDSRYGDLRIGGLVLQAVVGRRTGGARPYAVFGIGRYWMKNTSGVPNPYGMVWGATAGGGMAWGRGRIQPFAELRYDLLATDFGADEWSPTVYVPIEVGVRWRL